MAAASAHADVSHNGSRMDVVTFRDHVDINYLAPAPRLSGFVMRATRC